MPTAKRARVANPIATRRLTVAGDPDRVVVVTLGKPRRDPHPGGDFRVALFIEGLPGARRRFVHGLDPLQALLLAVEAARALLDASGLTLTWEGGEPGDTGVPRMVPGFYGRAFARGIERHIDAEVQAFARAAAESTET